MYTFFYDIILDQIYENIYDVHKHAGSCLNIFPYFFQQNVAFVMIHLYYTYMKLSTISVIFLFRQRTRVKSQAVERHASTSEIKMGRIWRSARRRSFLRKAKVRQAKSRKESRFSRSGQIELMPDESAPTILLVGTKNLGLGYTYDTLFLLPH